MRVVSEADAMQSLPSLLQEVKTHSVVIRQGEEELGALVSMDDYEIVRRANIERFLKLCDQIGNEIAAKAKEQRVPLEEVQRHLLSDEE
jgi:hypothetical protein